MVVPEKPTVGTAGVDPQLAPQEVDETVQKDFRGLDDASKFLQGREDITWTEEEERAILRKIDRRLLPLMMLAGVIVYMDSQAFGSAAIFGMIKDLNLYTVVSTDPVVTETSRYSWASSITSFGSVISQYPLLLLAQKLPLGKFAGCVILYSGFFALVMVVAGGFPGTMVIRFLYGFQVVGTPVNIIITAMWWKTEEQAVRVSLWFVGAPFGALIGQAFAYGAVQIGGPFADSPWKWIYILIGSFSIVYSFLFLWLFPDSPMKATFLTDRERHIAVLRLRSNNTGIQTRQFKRLQVFDTVKDPQTWLLIIIKFAFAFANICYGNFAGLLLTGLGYDTLDAITLLMPSSAIIVVAIVSAGFVSYIFKLPRTMVACAYILPSIAGYCIIWQLSNSNRAALLGGLYISVFFYGAYIHSVSLVSSNVAGHTKKTTMNALIGTFAYVGAIVGPFSFRGEEAAIGYPTGMTTVLCMMVVICASFIALMTWYKIQNKRKISYCAENPDFGRGEDMAFSDLTDRENPHFRYTL